MKRNKITMVGGGQIGGNLALLASQKELGDIVIFDIPKAEGMVKGKALDLMQLRPHDGYDTNISGTSNWDDVKDSDVFIITAGIPRKPGMNREDLLEINLGIMKDVAENIKQQAPNAFVIVISNPLDAEEQASKGIEPPALIFMPDTMNVNVGNPVTAKVFIMGAENVRGVHLRI